MRIGQSYIKAYTDNAYTDKVKSNQSVYGQKLNQKTNVYTDKVKSKKIKCVHGQSLINAYRTKLYQSIYGQS